MSIIQQGFSHSSSSLMIGKIQGNIIDTLLAPLSAIEVTLAIILAAVNIFGGFLVTQRMLAMYKKKKKDK